MIADRVGVEILGKAVASQIGNHLTECSNSPQYLAKPCEELEILESWIVMNLVVVDVSP